MGEFLVSDIDHSYLAFDFNAQQVKSKDKNFGRRVPVLAWQDYELVMNKIRRKMRRRVQSQASDLWKTRRLRTAQLKEVRIRDADEIY